MVTSRRTIGWAAAAAVAAAAFGAGATQGTAQVSAARVATFPTPGRVQTHSEPTENQCDCTAAPTSPVRGSWATIEKVP